MLTAIITFNGEINAFSYGIRIQQFWMLTATLNFLFMKLKMHPVILEKEYSERRSPSRYGTILPS